MEDIIVLLSHFIILFYIFYKNYFQLNLSFIEILRKYKKLLIFLLSLPIILLFLNKISLKINLTLFIFFNSYFIIILFSFLLFLALKRDKRFEFYDKSLYIFIYNYIVCFVLNINRSEKGFILFISILLITFSVVALQALCELLIMIYQYFKFIKNKNLREK